MFQSGSESGPQKTMTDAGSDISDAQRVNPAAVLSHQIVAHAFADVCELDLAGRGLSTLPDAIGHLTHLTKLNCMYQACPGRALRR